MRLQPYSAYKLSDIEWLGDVPEHWDTLPSRAMFSEVQETGHSHETMLSVTIANGVIQQGELLVDSSKKDQSRIDRSAYKLVQPGDIAYNKMRAWQGAIGVSRYRGIVSPAYVVQRPTDSIDVAYMHYLFRTPAFAKEAERNSYGIASDMWSLRSEDFKRIQICLPPLEEQTAIAHYLGHATEQIERHIRAKEKMIALLEEQKQVIIHDAVTGRIDVRTGMPFPHYKPSDVEWLGEVPAHWKVSRVKAEFDCLNHHRRPLSGTERGEMTLRQYDYYGASGVIDKVDSYLFDDELLLIAEDGANLVLRNLPLAIIARGNFWVNNHAHILKPKRGNLEYLAEVMEGLNYLPWISGAAQPKLTQDRLMSIAIAVSPVEEQSSIASFISDETGHIRIAIDRARREIDLLRQYRTRLIADVVTGKLDVREAAKLLPNDEFIPSTI